MRRGLMRPRTRTLVGTTVLALVAGAPAVLGGQPASAATSGPAASHSQHVSALGTVTLRNLAHAAAPQARAAAPESPSTALGPIAPDLPENRQVNLTNPGGPPPGSLSVPTPKPVPIAGKDGDKGFPGLTHLDQVNAGTGAYAGTQFSLEPPDQALCTDGTHVLESVNTALAVYGTDGSVLAGATPINQFLGLAPEDTVN